MVERISPDISEIEDNYINQENDLESNIEDLKIENDLELNNEDLGRGKRIKRSPPHLNIYDRSTK